MLKVFVNPGEGPNVSMTFDEQAFLVECRLEIEKLLTKNIAAKKGWPSLKKSTEERKARRGSATPGQQLSDSGHLLDSLRIELNDGRLQIFAPGYYLFNQKDFPILKELGKTIAGVLTKWKSKLLKQIG